MEVGHDCAGARGGGEGYLAALVLARGADDGNFFSANLRHRASRGRRSQRRKIVSCAPLRAAVEHDGASSAPHGWRWRRSRSSRSWRASSCTTAPQPTPLHRGTKITTTTSNNVRTLLRHGPSARRRRRRLLQRGVPAVAAREILRRRARRRRRALCAGECAVPRRAAALQFSRRLCAVECVADRRRRRRRRAGVAAVEQHGVSRVPRARPAPRHPAGAADDSARPRRVRRRARLRRVRLPGAACERRALRRPVRPRDDHHKLADERHDLGARHELAHSFGDFGEEYDGALGGEDYSGANFAATTRRCREGEGPQRQRNGRLVWQCLNWERWLTPPPGEDRDAWLASTAASSVLLYAEYPWTVLGARRAVGGELRPACRRLARRAAPAVVERRRRRRQRRRL